MATPYTQVHKKYKLYINCTYRISLDDLLKVRQGQNKVITSNIFSNRRLTELLMINFMIHFKLLKSTYSLSKHFGLNSATLLLNSQVHIFFRSN